MTRCALIGASTLALIVAACGGADDGTTSGLAQQPLGAACDATRGDVPADGWICGESRTVECSSASGTPVGTIHVVEADLPSGNMLCSSGDLLDVSDPGPYGLGEHVIEVSRIDAAGASSLVCTSTLTVTDTTPPEVTTTDLNLWPPNHKWHYVSPTDCVTATDACDEDVDAVFLWASSDESVDGLGDGHHEPDIRNLSCEGVELRAERSGNENGRVYKLGVRVFDDEGNTTDAVCVVTVVHDQRGAVAVDDGEDHRVDLPEGECGPSGGGSGGGSSGGGGSGGGSTGGESAGGGGQSGGSGGLELPPGGL